MRRIDTSYITNDIRMPITQGVLDHLQQAYTETSGYLANFLSNAHLPPDKVYILYGAVLAPDVTSPTTVSKGLVYWNGELFPVEDPGIPGAGTGGAPLMTMNHGHVYTPAGDPVMFTDGVARDVLPRRTIKIAMGIPGGGSTGDYICDYKDAIRICPPVPLVQDGIVWDGNYMVKFDCNYNLFLFGSGTSMGLRFDVSTVAVGATTRMHVSVPSSIPNISMVPPPMTDVKIEWGNFSGVGGMIKVIYATYHGFANGMHRIGLSIY